MTCDQLYGLDASYISRPQMAAGHELSEDGLRWRFIQLGWRTRHGINVARQAMGATIQCDADRETMLAVMSEPKKVTEMGVANG